MTKCSYTKITKAKNEKVIDRWDQLKVETLFHSAPITFKFLVVVAESGNNKALFGCWAIVTTFRKSQLARINKKILKTFQSSPVYS